MNRGLSILGLLLASTSCSFRSSLEVRVDMFDGTGVVPVDTTPDAVEVTAVAQAVVEQARVAADKVGRAAEHAAEAATVANELCLALAGIEEATRKTPGFASSAQAYRDAAVTALRALGTMKSDARKSATLGTVEDAIRAAAPAKGLVFSTAAVDGVTIGELLYQELLFAVADRSVGEREAAIVVGTTLVRGWKSIPEEVRPGFLELLRTSPEALTSLADFLHPLNLTQDGQGPDPTGACPSRAAQLVESDAQALRGTAREGVETVVQAHAAVLAELVAKPMSAPALAVAGVKLAGASAAMGDILRNRAEQFGVTWRATGWTTVADWYLGAAPGAAAKLPEVLRVRLEHVLEADSSHLTADEIAAALRAPIEDLTRVVVNSRAALNRVGSAMVGRTRIRPFVAADPNIKLLLREDAEEHWCPIPVDSLLAWGDGDAQYVVVQDSPTVYRIKEMHLDPQGVVELQVSMADLGFELFEKVAQATGYLPSGGGSQPATVAPPVCSRPGPRATLLEGEFRSVVNHMLMSLGRDAAALGSKGSALTPAAIEASLAARRAALEGLAQATRERCRQPAAEEPEPQPTPTASVGDGSGQ